MFDGRDVLLDGNTFVGCIFSDSQLVFKGTHPCRLTDNRLHEDVVWSFDGAARVTLEFLSMLYQRNGESGQQVVEELFEKIRRGWK